MSKMIVTTLNPWRPLLPYGYSYKASCARRSALTMATWQQWPSKGSELWLSARVLGCQKLQMAA